MPPLAANAFTLASASSSRFLRDNILYSGLFNLVPIKPSIVCICSVPESKSPAPTTRSSTVPTNARIVSGGLEEILNAACSILANEPTSNIAPGIAIAIAVAPALCGATPSSTIPL